MWNMSSKLGKPGLAALVGCEGFLVFAAIGFDGVAVDSCSLVRAAALVIVNAGIVEVTIAGPAVISHRYTDPR